MERTEKEKEELLRKGGACIKLVTDYFGNNEVTWGDAERITELIFVYILGEAANFVKEHHRIEYLEQRLNRLANVALESIKSKLLCPCDKCAAKHKNKDNETIH